MKMLMGVVGVVLAGEVFAAVTPAMEMAAPGAVKPRGWLLDVARSARDGYTGRMDEVDEQFRLAWSERLQPHGEQTHWWSQPGAWSAEGGAYWFAGLVRLAFQLDDDMLKAQISNRLETVLTKVNPGSWGFLWWLRRDDPEDVKALKSDAFLLSKTEELGETVCAWYRATGDARAKRALEIAFSKTAFELDVPFSGAYSAYRITRSAETAAMLDEYADRLAEDAWNRRYTVPPSDDLSYTLFLKFPQECRYHIQTRHGCGSTAGLLAVLRAYQWTGERKHLEALRAWFAFLDRHCRLPFGQTVMDEEWGWAGPRRASETCTAARENWTRLCVMEALGEGSWGDDVEESVFNVGPNCVTPDFRRHTYMQQPNRLAASDLTDCSHGGDPDPAGNPTTHGKYLEKHYPLCCTAALNRILPEFIQGMWMRTSDGGVAAALYGPCAFETEVAGGRFAVREETDYPFGEEIRLKVDAAPKGRLPIALRVPRWCGEMSVAVNGASVAPVAAKGFARIVREWKAGDIVTLRLPMKPRFATMKDMNDLACGEVAREYGYVKVGPLLMAQLVPSEDENTPHPPADLPSVTAADAARAELVRAPMPSRWDWPVDAPVKVRMNDASGKLLELIPYGSAKFRISMFPLAGR